MGFTTVNLGADDVEVPDGDMSFEQIAALSPDKKPAAAPAEEEPEIEEEADESGIEVVDDTDPADRGRPVAAADTPENDFVVTESELQSYKAKRTQERIATLARKGHEERRAKQEVLKQNNHLVDYGKTLYAENEKLRQMVQREALARIEATKRAAEGELLQAQAEYKEAFEQADPEKITAATTKLSRASTILSSLPTAPPVVPAAPQPDVAQVSPRLSAWVQKNQWFTSDQRLHNTAMGYHQIALAQGVPPDTDQYYDFIDRNMSAHLGGPAPTTAPAQTRPAAAAPAKPRFVAPVNPSGTSDAKPAPAKSGKVVLSKSEVDMARALGVPLVDYARQKQLREKGGDQ